MLLIVHELEGFPKKNIYGGDDIATRFVLISWEDVRCQSQLQGDHAHRKDIKSIPPRLLTFFKPLRVFVE